MDIRQVLSLTTSPNHLPMIKLLIDRYGAYLHTNNEQPLILALYYDSDNLLRYLIDKGAIVDQSRDDRWDPIKGKNPLEAAVYYGRYESLVCMIEKGTFRNRPGASFLTYLLNMTIERRDSVETVRYLIEQGATPTSYHRHEAARHRRIKSLLYLLDRNYDGKESAQLLKRVSSVSSLNKEDKKLIREFRKRHGGIKTGGTNNQSND